MSHSDIRTEKICFKCGKLKPISEYYKHPQMADGHLNKCKECTSTDVRERELILIESDPVWVAKEAERHRLKAERYRACGIYPTKEQHDMANKKWLENNTSKKKAHKIVSRAIKCGKLTKEPCSVCGSNEHIHAHHEDYSKPLEVIWLCAKHHRQQHWKHRELRLKIIAGEL